MRQDAVLWEFSCEPFSFENDTGSCEDVNEFAGM